MGNAHSPKPDISSPLPRPPLRPMTAEEMVESASFPAGLRFFEPSLRGSLRRDCMRLYSMVTEEDDALPGLRGAVSAGTVALEFGAAFDRALGVMLGNAIGDAMGAPLEFKHVQYGVRELGGFLEEGSDSGGKFRLKPGQWTDDFSMALCLAESLLANGGDPIDARDLRLRFMNWWEFGYCNAFGRDAERVEFDGGSVGLGGNIALSFQDFLKNQDERKSAGDAQTSGNGSIMRASPSVVYWHDNVIKAMATAERQSLCTHQGTEAAECARLLAWVCFHGINAEKKGDVRNVLSCLDSFESPIYSVRCLARSSKEEEHEDNKRLSLSDRNWNWRCDQYQYAETRANTQPGYVGSYVMDCLAMSLHCVYTTENFCDAVLKAINLRGDADSVGAVSAQIAGAIYGSDEIPRDWIRTIERWDGGGLIALRAYHLFNRTRLPRPSEEDLQRILLQESGLQSL